MKNIDYRMWIGLVIHFLVTFSQYGIYDNVVFFVGLLFVVLNVVGILFIATGKIKQGCYLYMAGSIFFIPIGLIGFFGARSILNKLKEKDFHEEINSIGNEQSS